LSFKISELGNKSIETPFVTSKQGIFYRTREGQRERELEKSDIIIFK